MSSTLIGLRITASLRSDVEHLGQRLGALGVAARERVVDRDAEQHEERAEQDAADHVGLG